MQFQVPQFIESENKIIGDLTFRQFLYLVIPAGIDLFLFSILERWLWLIIAPLLFGIGAIFAFQKINGRPAFDFLTAVFNYLIQPKLFLLPEAVPVTAPAPKISPVFKAPTITPEVSAPAIQPAPAITPKEAKPSPLNSILEKLSTTSNPIPKRETSADPWFQANWQKKYAVIKKITGEKETARRVDYR